MHDACLDHEVMPGLRQVYAVRPCRMHGFGSGFVNFQGWHGLHC